MRSDWQGIVAALAACCAFGFAACGGDGGGNGGDNGGADAGETDTDGGGMLDVGVDADTGTQCTTEADCGVGETCEDGECVEDDQDACTFIECESNDECEEPTPFCNARDNVCVECQSDSQCDADGAVCDNFQCEVPDAQCESVGDSCDPEAGSFGIGFECSDVGTGEAQCVRTCNPELDSPCDSGSVCLGTGSESSAPGICYPSQCDGPDDLDGCDNVDNSNLFPNAETLRCASTGNDAFLCLPEGSASVGESCVADSPQLIQNGSACEAGATCQGGTCRQVCRDGASDDALTCGGGDECVGTGAENVVSDGGGFCGEQCDAYSRGQCSGQDRGCSPLNDDIGYCRNIGDKGFMEDCQPPSASNPGRNECQEGMQCITFQQGNLGQDPIAKCMPVCDAPGSDDNNRDDNDATCGGMMYGRFAHLATEPSTVDVYIDGNERVSNLSAEMVSDADESTDGSQFFGFRPRELTVDVTNGMADDNSNPLVQVEPFAKSGQVFTWAIVRTGSGIDIEPIEVPLGVEMPAEGNAAVRLVHLVPDLDTAVDVVAVPQEGDIQADGVELAAGADRGTVGGFAEVAADTYDVYVFPEGATRQEGEAVQIFEGIELQDGERSSLYVKGTAASGDAAQVGVVAVPYTAAPNAPEYTCWNRGQQDPAPASGLCFQGCDNEDFGQNSCHVEGNGCSVLGDGTAVCTPAGEKAPGESCNPQRFDDCQDGATCQPHGDDNATCRSFCVGGDPSNQSLECGEGNSCTSNSPDSVGTCQPSCQPDDNFVDQDCPEGLKSCFPESVSDGMPQGAQCSASNNLEVGEECGGSADRQIPLQNCAPGLICAYDSGTDSLPLYGPVIRRPDEKPTCQEPCDPFAEDPGCPEGKACGVTPVLTNSSEAGVCMDKAQCVSETETGTNCTEANLGTLCGNGSHCVSSQDRVLCLEFCDVETGEGCTGDTVCQEFGGGLGQCVTEN
jgi:hypothetical protein